MLVLVLKTYVFLSQNCALWWHFFVLDDSFVLLGDLATIHKILANVFGFRSIAIKALKIGTKVSKNF